MSFWDDPQHRPPSSGGGLAVGDIVEGALTLLDLRDSRYGDRQLVWAVDGYERWANTRLWRALAAARVEVGDRIRVQRGPDEAARAGGHAAPTTWTVSRISPSAQPVPGVSPPSARKAPVW